MGLDFIRLFNKKLEEKDIDWEVSALASPDGKLFSLGSDSKLIGRIFELISYNILQEIADENGQPSGYVFTLGSFASYMRDGKKNISFPYDQYAKHYVIGFVYTRNDNASEGQMFDIKDLGKLPVPYKDVEVFVQEKYKISGDKPGSGNTENIGSFKTNRMEYLVNGEGPFSGLGIDIYEDYWAGYKKYRGELTYTSLDGYFDVQEEQGNDIARLKRNYEYWKKTHK